MSESRLDEDSNFKIICSDPFPSGSPRSGKMWSCPHNGRGRARFLRQIQSFVFQFFSLSKISLKVCEFITFPFIYLCWSSLF